MTLAICQVLQECPARPIWPVLDSIVRVVVRKPPLVRAGVTLYERLINYLLHGLRRD
ncbi:hypothetical protein [Herbaspirillum aquaticum]|jgi:hypothetical protein|uniref:hypothetical protein n=1 Tax=Herbaspirillum aquaticum TaxID=568783 RepID=UPI001303F240|nr:hypothetical protein [Herbaspirillum aquaticum]